MQFLPFVTLEFLPYFKIPSIFQDSPTQTSYITWNWDLPRLLLDSSFGVGCVEIIADNFFFWKYVWFFFATMANVFVCNCMYTKLSSTWATYYYTHYFCESPSVISSNHMIFALHSSALCLCSDIDGKAKQEQWEKASQFDNGVCAAFL